MSLSRRAFMTTSAAGITLLGTNTPHTATAPPPRDATPADTAEIIGRYAGKHQITSDPNSRRPDGTVSLGVEFTGVRHETALATLDRLSRQLELAGLQIQSARADSVRWVREHRTPTQITGDMETFTDASIEARAQDARGFFAAIFNQSPVTADEIRKIAIREGLERRRILYFNIYNPNGENPQQIMRGVDRAYRDIRHLATTAPRHIPISGTVTPP